MPVPDSYRTFVAIEIPHRVRALVAQHIDRLRRDMPDVRASWSREDNLHLTLKFLGNVPVADIPNVSDCVERAAREITRFQLTLCGCGVFPPHGRPATLWIGAEGPANLPALHSAIEDECAAAGFARESRPFHPHLTIARLRKPEGGRGLADLHKNLGFAPETFAVSEVVLFRSELLREGSKHTEISRHELRN